jgi:hypothetical protein
MDVIEKKEQEAEGKSSKICTHQQIFLEWGNQWALDERKMKNIRVMTKAY